MLQILRHAKAAQHVQEALLAGDNQRFNLFEWPWKENKAARGRSLVPPILWCPKHYLYKPVRSIRGRG